MIHLAQRARSLCRLPRMLMFLEDLLPPTSPWLLSRLFPKAQPLLGTLHDYILFLCFLLISHSPLFSPTPTLNFTKPAATPTRSNAPPSENVVKPVLSFPATSQSRSAPTTPEKSRWDMMAGLEHLTPAARRLYEQNKYAMSSKSKLSVSTFSEEVNYTSGSDNAQQ